MGLTPSVSVLEKRILDLQTERQTSEDFMAKYKFRWEKVKKEKEALEAEKGDIHCHLEEVYSKVEAEAVAEAERVAKAEHQGYWRGHDDNTKFFRERLVILAPGAFCWEGYFEAYVKYVEAHRQAQAEG